MNENKKSVLLDYLTIAILIAAAVWFIGGAYGFRDA
jgi:hypothetical protein